MLNQSVRQLGKNNLSSHRSKIYQIIIITNIEIWTARYHKKCIWYEHTARFYKTYVQLKHGNKQPAENFQNLNWLFPSLYSRTSIKIPKSVVQITGLRKL